MNDLTAPGLISTKEVAARKGVTVKTVNLWAQRGILAVADVVPIIGARLFDPDVVDAFDPKSSSVGVPSADGGTPLPDVGPAAGVGDSTSAA